MENVVADPEISSQLLFLLDPAAEDIPPDSDWPLNLPIENATEPPGSFVVGQSEVQRIEENDDSEDEFVDVEGGCYPTIAETELDVDSEASGVLLVVQGDPSLTVKDTMVLCAICIKPFSSMDDCKNHMKLDHDLVGTDSGDQEPASLPMKTTIKIPEKSHCSRRQVILDQIARPVTSSVCKAVGLKHPEEVNMVIRKESESNSRCTVEFSCDKCELKFSKPEFLARHAACHVKRQFGFSCSECKDYFKKWTDCLAHLWKAHKIEVQLHNCECCGSKFLKQYQLLSHQSLHCEFKEHVCDICNKGFRQTVQLKAHKETHEPVEKRGSRKECQICHRIYANFRSLKQHMKSVHGEKSLTCFNCGFKTARKFILETHMRSHTGDKPFCCDFCDARFADQNTLRRHKMFHLNDKCYHCPCCDSSFIQSIHLIKHVLQNHPDHKGTVMQCEACQFKTINKQRYLAHVKQKHPELKNAVEACKRIESLPIPDNLIRNIDLRQVSTSAESSVEEPLAFYLTDHSNNSVPV